MLLAEDEPVATDRSGAIQFSYADPSHNALQRGLIHLIERLTGQPKLRRLYYEHQALERPPEEFFAAALERLELEVVHDGKKLEPVSKNGPLVVIANHPYGVVDGLIICWLTQKVRSKFSILTNAVLCQAPELEGVALPIDFSGTRDALHVNLESRRIARERLAAGEAVIVFPGGAVANTESVLSFGAAVDWTWQPFTSALIRYSRASVLPMYFHGQNSRAFQIASHISPTLRLSLLFNEVHRLMGQQIRVTIGDEIPFEYLSPIRDRVALATHLRDLTHQLAK